MELKWRCLIRLKLFRSVLMYLYGIEIAHTLGPIAEEEGSNCTFMELKFTDGWLRMFQLKRSNCTFMELK